VSIIAPGAYRLKTPHLLPEVLHEIRVRGQANIKQSLRELYAQMMLAVREDTPLFRAKASKIKPHWGVRLEIAHDLVVRMYRRGSTMTVRSAFNFDVGVSVHYFQDQWVFVPHTNWLVQHVLDFMADDPRLEDFHYETATDAPSDVPPEKWAEREAWFAALSKTEASHDRLMLVLCDWDHLIYVDPWLDMLREFHERGGPDGL
jgi:hypothetical protein